MFRSRPHRAHGQHPHLPGLLAEHRTRALDRREFLTRATALGATASLAQTLAGVVPASAEDARRQGGTLRIQMSVRELKDPRLWDWSEIANFCRGWLEYLVEYRADGVLHGMLLDRWEVSDDVSEYILHLRRGVLWSNGDPFTAEDVLHNLARWCEADVPGNSMAPRLRALMDEDTGRLRLDAAEALDDLTVRLRLSRPDVTIIPTLADYPAAIVHRSYTGGDPSVEPLGTGPYLPEPGYTPGEAGALVRRTERPWWGTDVFGGPFLDRIEFRDYGTDPASFVEALEAGEVDMLDQTSGVFVEVLDTKGFARSDVLSAATYIVRVRQDAGGGEVGPYGDAAFRRGLALAVSNEICLELGYVGHGEVAANHHVSPLQPDHAEIGPAPYAPRDGVAAIEAAGWIDVEHELISIDDEWQNNTCDAVAAMLRDAGLKVRRRRLPGAEFWAGWRTHVFSGTEWNMRPLGVQVLALAYTTGSDWNETGYSNPEFDALIEEALGVLDAETRSDVMRRAQEMLRADGVIIQPYWRQLFRHGRDDLVGTAIHPMLEMHLYKMGFRA